MTVLSLLADDSLVLDHDDASASYVVAWVPRNARLIASGRDAEGAIQVRTGDVVRSIGIAGPALLSLGGVAAWATGVGSFALRSRNVAGEIDLEARVATVVIDAFAGSAVHAGLVDDVRSTLTLSAALLLNRLNGALVHAGAVCDQLGRGWVVVGDTHSGKTTTCISLVSANWKFLADDQIVMRHANDGSAAVEGWPRVAHLDEGWRERAVKGARMDFDVCAEWPGRCIRTAPVAGVILPTIAPASETSARVTTAGDALEALIRQAPWLMADRASAASILSLLRSAAVKCAIHVSLGADSFGPGDALAHIIERAIASSSA